MKAKNSNGISAFWSAIVFLFIFAFASEAAYLIQHSLTVCSQYMGCVRGKLMPGFQTEEFEAFLGIPYALPPMGPLRFSSPKAFPRWSGIRNASEIKTDCIQKNHLVPNPQVLGSEDCLYLNIYRPANRGKQLLPVLVYIHGGGWFSGTASPLVHGPEYFMDTREVILITFAYRLGALGFLSTNDGNMSGNFGLKDQNLALRWIQRNIQAFGGNPKMVTIFGQSAGSISAHMHMLSKQSNGLFNRVIALSGTANVPFAITLDPLEQTRKIAQLCNIPNANNLNTANLTLALRNIDAQTLVNSADGLKYWDVDPMTSFRPVVESYCNAKDAFLVEHPEKTLSTGNYEPKPWMTSFVPHEGAVRATAILENKNLRTDFNSDFDRLFELLMELPGYFNATQQRQKALQIIDEYFDGIHELNSTTGQGLMDSITDRGFHRPLFNAVRNYVDTVNTDDYPIYLFKFNYRGPLSFTSFYVNGETSRDYGVVHCDDLLYLFRAPILFPDFAKNSTEVQVIKAMIGNVIHFAKYGTPIKSNELESCNRNTFNSSPNKICDYLDFSSRADTFKINIRNEFNVKRVKFWNDILRKSYSL